MVVPTPARTVAVHPSQHGQHPQHAAAAGSARLQQQQPISQFTPSERELAPGGRNRLFLALRSGVEEEVDWALPRLVLASFDRPDKFALETWVDSVSSLKEWPERWLDELEREVAYRQLIDTPSSSKRDALGAVPSFTRNPAVEDRAAASLHILRNASFSGNNPRTISRTSFVQFILRFFNLPIDFLIEVSARSPEPFQHLLIILQSIYPFLFGGPPVFRLLTEVLPTFAMKTRDVGLLSITLPILITTFQVPTFPPPPDGFIEHILYLLTLQPPPQLLELVLDLLAAMVPQPAYARTVLSDPQFGAHLKSLVRLLEHGASDYVAQWFPVEQLRSHEVLNPAGGPALAERATARRRIEREADQQKMEVFGGPGVTREVGTTPPQLSQTVKDELYKMTEPKRSIAWMHETFVYCSHAQLLQVTFWHAYRDFFSNAATVEQLLSASEVIKNVTVAFPAAQAKLWTDERGDTKFVISGMGFRKGTDDADRFLCFWRGCQRPQGATNPGQLLDHIQKAHLAGHPQTCSWAGCRHSPFTLSHLLTHLPLQQAPSVQPRISVTPGTDRAFVYSSNVTARPLPPVPPGQLLRFEGKRTPADAARNPIGIAFLSALVVRGLARSLRSEVAAALPEEVGMSVEQRQAKKKHLAEDRFGLPIPASVLREEEEEEDEARGAAEVSMPDADRERARAAFRAVEGRILDVVNTNVSSLGLYLGDAFGW
ncbi:hypothetical protein VHUM_02637 [Vanrija humicola]|uniref:RFX-type winged-helix domain-containing protein n=1 Tax=Vanrija humicola TaxID=5417 RepID=A0A7D8Z3M0_VANHU|nr:hypothetical protein VHUM_02637 [Vanrija humicola]